MFGREVVIASGKPFGYKEQDISNGIRALRKNLELFRAQLRSPEYAMRDAAKSAVPRLEASLQYVQERPPRDMIEELRQIYQFISKMEGFHIPIERIEDQLSDRYGEQITYYGDLLLGNGWIVSALQRVTTAKMRRDSS